MAALSRRQILLPAAGFGIRQRQNIEHDAVSQELWQEWLAKISAQKTLLIYDTCESAAASGLALQLHFYLEMGALRCGLMRSSPQGPFDDMSGFDVSARHADGDAPDLLHLVRPDFRLGSRCEGTRSSAVSHEQSLATCGTRGLSRINAVAGVLVAEGFGWT
jgi:hypothetical protein